MKNGPFDANRRDFFKTVGATFVSLQAAACLRKPKELILPYQKRPEDLLPGEPRYFATAYNHGGAVQGLVVKSTDGRPTKIEGSPAHPMSHGATNAWAQASVLELYAPERSTSPFSGDEAAESEAGDTFLAGLATQLAESKGKGLAILIDDRPSPTLHRLLGEVTTKYPEAKLYHHDAAGDEHARAGAALVGLGGTTWSVRGTPRIIATFDADPMATEGDAVAFQRAFAKGRSDPKSMSRLFSVEPNVTLTGSNADHRLPLPASKVPAALAAVAARLATKGLALPSLPAEVEPEAKAFLDVLADDLASARGASLVVVGERQPAAVHALAHLINAALGNVGKTVVYVKHDRPRAASLSDLTARMKRGEVTHLVVLGGNPVYDAPGDLGFADALAKVGTSVHLGLVRDETGQRCAWHFAESHYLESWGDLVARDGTLSIQQPLIAPLYYSVSAIELVARLLGKTDAGYALVRETHRGLAPSNFDRRWQRWLHDGVVADAKAKPAGAPTSGDLTSTWPKAEEGGVELVFVRDPSVLDGRFGGSPWLQELPDPITKLTWDNAALVSPKTAARLGLTDGDFVNVGHHGQDVRIPAWIQPGTADDVVVLPIGYGREAGGPYASSGFDVNGLRMTASPWTLTGGTIAKAGGQYELACTQIERSTHGRTMHRSATVGDFLEEPNFVEKFEIMEPDVIKSLWEEPNPKDGHQWGMSIDLNKCTSCNACTVACQSENNIPWVGKHDTKVGREMHWIRVDRYVEEIGGEAEFMSQPVACSHCETAPCENVCPVQATAHSPEGMNDMAYNRCIGTRYCANNCPYKVRRFNFHNYTLRNDEAYGMGIAMQRNPDVTVRFRGVMEKCTYCVQRVNRGRIEAKVEGDGNIKDGAVTPACAQACPTEAITFGNLNDPSSRIAAKKKDPRNYAMISELNIRPRTTYLAKLKNPNPNLTKKKG